VIAHCDCGAAPFGRHDPACAVVDLRRRKRIDCEHCERDDVPGARGQWFIDRDYCHSCEDNYDGAPMYSDTGGESADERHRAAWHEKQRLNR
jgi:hypothetical protein